jgi:hypothetical protein
MVPDPILITGAARSGTSLVAGIIHKCGAWGGLMSGPTPYNKKGMFENEVIRNSIVKTWLSRRGYDPLCQDPLPPRKVDPDPFWYGIIVKAIQQQEYPGGHWFYKGAKMCLMWQLWHFAFSEATWIIVRRNVDEIANSCMRTPFMKSFTTHIQWIEWATEHEQRFKDMKEEGLRIVGIWPEKIINGDASDIRLFIQEFGLQWNEKEIEAFIDPELWGGQSG